MADLGKFLVDQFGRKRVSFTPLEETTLIKDMDGGTIMEGLTEADVAAIEWLGFPRYEICSKKRLKEKWHCNEPHAFLRFTISQYYSYLANEDRRYLKFQKYRFKELACLGFTFEFYERMVIDLVDWIRREVDNSKTAESKEYWQKQIKLIRGDLRATNHEGTIELVKRV